MSTGFQAVRGMNDILPDDAERWEFLEENLRDWLRSYGYRPMRSPILEYTSLFVRSIGEVTDIVEKEMYSFVDRLNGESLTLRPEATAACVRVALEHNLLYNGPQRLSYLGPMFRHERPQKGRYRQFHQCGAEALGFAGPDVDAELIVMTGRLWQRLGISDVALEVNSIGSSDSRARHRARLVAHFEAHQDLLTDEERHRLAANPLRLLDSKNPQIQGLVEDAPRLVDELDDYSAAHFEGLQSRLRAAGLSYRINPRLVRGLDYYNATVFEWTTPMLGAQGTICGGGRYDGLVEQLGGKPAPGCGFAMGLERLLALMGATALSPLPVVYVVHQGEAAAQQALVLAERLRTAGLDTLLHCGGGSMKSQLKRADASGARYALILGEDEVREGRVSVKPLRGQGVQVTAPVETAIELMKQT